MGSREIKVDPKDYYRPVHQRTLEEYAKVAKTYKYNADETAEQKKWDFLRYSDNVYRFNVQVLRMIRVLDERDGQEYLTRIWNVNGKSEIGNFKPFIKIDNIDTYKVPIVEQKVVQVQGSQNLKTTAGDIIRTEMRYLTPFTVDNVIECLKDSMPPYSLRFLQLYIKRGAGEPTYTLDKRYFIAWLLAPFETLEEFNKQKEKGISLKEFTLDKYRANMNEFQVKKLEEIIANSNIVTIDMDEAKQKEHEEKAMLDKGLTLPDAKEKVVVRVKKESSENVERNEGRKTF